MRLKNKVVLITGAASGIGLATAKRFVDEGASVMLADINVQDLAKAVGKLNSTKVESVVVDVADPDQVAEMISVTTKIFGRLDVFIANAGIEGKMGEIIDSEVSNFDKVMAVNVRGVWLGLKYVIPVLRENDGGSIIITSSGAGVKGAPGISPYTTSKHAVIGLMRCAALECAKYNIRVNTVNPGPVETRMMDAIEEGYMPGEGGQFKQQIIDATPLHRYAQPQEVASMMLFLASDDSSYCTGGVYMVDGGNST